MSHAATSAASRGDLPFHLTRFIGRRNELAELADMLGPRRLLTIAGAGGCGKSRLAREALAGLGDRWADGVRWVALESVSDESRVPDVIAAAVGLLVDPAVGPRRALIRGVRDLHVVLCLDNCEHLLDACAQVVEELLSSCANLVVLATSREPLGVPGEAVWRVPSMPEPDAMELFADRARGVRPAYVTDASNEAAVQTVCRRLDGIPLAIELAAAWVWMLTPAQISAAVNDRFRLLAGGPRRVVHRHQTLAASVAWSYDLLAGNARTLLRRLAVFSGGFTLEAAETVCWGGDLAADEVLAALRALVDASMCNADGRAGASRYWLLETIREYAAQRADADELEAARDRHVDAFLMLAESATAALEHDDQDVVLAALEADHDNFRAALEWGLSRPDPTRGCRLACALAPFWFLHGHAYEGIRHLQRAIELAADDSGRQARLLSGLSMLGIPGGRLDLVDDAARRALRISAAVDDHRVLARAYTASAYLAFYVDFPKAQELARLARHHGRRAGESFAADFAVLVEAYCLINRHHHDAAIALAVELYERAMRRRQRFTAAFARGVEQWAALYTGDVRAAVAHGVDAVEIATPLNDSFAIGTNLIHLAYTYGTAGDVEEARRLMERVLRSVEDAGPDVDVVGISWIAGDVHLWAGELEDAVQWYRRTIRQFDAMPDNWIGARILPVLADALRRLGHPDEAAKHADHALAVAGRLPAPYIVAAALDQQALLAVADDPSRAEDLHHQAMRVRVEHGIRTFLADSLDHLARLAAAGGRFVETVRLLAASDAARQRMGYPRPPVQQPEHDAVLAAARTALDDDFEPAWSEGSLLTLDDAVAYASRSRGPRQRPSAGWSSLTPTEQQVVALVAEGLTNPGIADRMFISRATVKTHLSHVYAKLGVANRAGLAALAGKRASTTESRGIDVKPG